MKCLAKKINREQYLSYYGLVKIVLTLDYFDRKVSKHIDLYLLSCKRTSIWNKEIKIQIKRWISFMWTTESTIKILVNWRSYLDEFENEANDVQLAMKKHKMKPSLRELVSQLMTRCQITDWCLYPSEWRQSSRSLISLIISLTNLARYFSFISMQIKWMQWLSFCSSEKSPIFIYSKSIYKNLLYNLQKIKHVFACWLLPLLWLW